MWLMCLRKREDVSCPEPPGVPRRRTAVRIAGAAVVAGALLSGCGSGGATEPSGGHGAVHVRAAYVPGATFLPAMVAKDTGIFARHGLDVDLTPTQTLSTIPATLGRQFDFGPAVPPVVIKAVGNGIGIAGVVTSSVEQADDASELIVPKGSPVRSVADLRGKRLGTADSGAALHAATLYWLKSSGVDPQASRAVEMPFPTMKDQLEAGRVDAVEAIQPFSEIMIKAGARSLGAPMLAVSKPRVVSTLWIAQRGWAEKHRDVVARWKASLAEAQQVITREPDKARAILQKYTKLPAAVTKTVKLPVYAAQMPPAQLAQGVAPWQNALVQIGAAKGGLKPEQLVVMGS
jgi:NitT/TauT family transport system substrate-binding protein